MVREDEATQRGYARMGQAVTPVRKRAKMKLNVAKTRVGGCRWINGDVVKGQVPLAASEAVGKEATELCG